ncbi:hypothetical protein GF362_01370 [Candidatus Dojkabacteria bacterium]|nr:hypothetical protein [Candidatus Dojkabacteria bacterium]
MVTKLAKKSRKSYVIFFLAFTVVLGIIFVILLTSRLKEPEKVSPEQGEASVIRDEQHKYLYAVQSVLKEDGSTGWIKTCKVNQNTDVLEEIFEICSSWETFNFLNSAGIPTKETDSGQEIEITNFGGYDAIPFVDESGTIQKVRQVVLDGEKTEPDKDVFYWTRVCNIDTSGNSIYGVKNWAQDCEKWSKSGLVSEIGLLPVDSNFLSVVDFAAHDFTYKGEQRAFFGVVSVNSADYSIIEQMTGKYFESSNFDEIDPKMHAGEAAYWLAFPGLYSAHGSFSYIMNPQSSSGQEKVVERIISEGGTRFYGRLCDIENNEGGAVSDCQWEDAGVLNISNKNGEQITSFGGYGVYTFTTEKEIVLNK